MKRNNLFIFIALLLPLTLACSLLSAPTGPVSQVPPTRTPMPLFTPTPTPGAATNTPVATATPAEAVVPVEEAAVATDTPIPEPVEVAPTDTPEAEPTDTPEPAPTDTPVPPPPADTPVPPPPAPTDTPVPAPAGPAVGQYGISGKVIARDKTTFAVGEKAFFTYEANNHTDAPVNFALLGIKASNGQFNTSWINPDTINPGVPFRHDDGLTFDVPGTYQVFLAICYAFCDGDNSVWEEYPSGAVTITVQ